jgi:hypothetical protein
MVIIARGDGPGPMEADHVQAIELVRSIEPPMS